MAYNLHFCELKVSNHFTCLLLHSARFFKLIVFIPLKDPAEALERMEQPGT